MSASAAYTQSDEQVYNAQSTAGSGGAAIGANSTGNTINVTSADVNALLANQNVTEAAISSNSNVSLAALEALTQGNANSDIVVATALHAIDAASHDAENVGLALGTQAQDLASQAISGAGYGTQSTYDPTPIIVGSTDSSAPKGIDAQTLALYLGIAVSIVTLAIYLKRK